MPDSSTNLLNIKKGGKRVVKPTAEQFVSFVTKINNIRMTDCKPKDSYRTYDTHAITSSIIKELERS
jgi:hypothetical protein